MSPVCRLWIDHSLPLRAQTHLWVPMASYAMWLVDLAYRSPTCLTCIRLAVLNFSFACWVSLQVLSTGGREMPQRTACKQKRTRLEEGEEAPVTYLPSNAFQLAFPAIPSCTKRFKPPADYTPYCPSTRAAQIACDNLLDLSHNAKAPLQSFLAAPPHVWLQGVGNVEVGHHLPPLVTRSSAAPAQSWCFLHP